MKIIYLTSAIDNDDYISFLKNWSIKPNSSNQYFHAKLIKTISLDNLIDVISFRPINNNCRLNYYAKEDKIIGNISWHYLSIYKNKIKRYITCYKQCLKINKNLTHNDIIIVDSLNYLALLIANKLKRKYGSKLIIILTDKISNITNIKNNYEQKIIKQIKNADGYISLTKQLNDFYNLHKKESVIIKGITENKKIDNTYTNKYGKYIYFDGSLLPYYGINELIKAIEKLDDKSIKLVISGHHYNDNFEEQIKNKNVTFLKTLINDDVQNLMENAFININPRPYDKKIDDYAVPSKVIEYTKHNGIVISGYSSQLYEVYQDTIIWIKDVRVDNLIASINKAINLDEKKRNSMIEKMNEACQTTFSIKAINQNINNFLKNIIK